MTTQRQLKRAAPRPGFGNTNAAKRPQELAIYRATELLHDLLARAPVPRAHAIAYMRKRGIGFNTTHRAAALLGVPTGSQSGKRCLWALPANGERIEHVWTVLTRIELHGRKLGAHARKQRGEALAQWRGDRKLGTKPNTKPLGHHHVRKNESHEILSPKERRK